MEFLKVKNWNEFQHYAKRNPPWIKLHRSILDDYKFCILSDANKAHLILLWLYASQNDGSVPNDSAYLENKLSCKNLNLEIFVDAGFLIREIGNPKLRAAR